MSSFQRDVWARLQLKEGLGPNGSSISPRRISSLPCYHPNDSQHIGIPSACLKDDWISKNTAIEQSSRDSFISSGTPTSSECSENSGSEDEFCIPQPINEQSRYCPCCCRIFAKDFYLFGHLKRSKKCKILCGERGCERPINGMHEMLMCYNSRHRFHCQKCERRFKSWGGLHKHFFSSRDCFKGRNYKFGSTNQAMPRTIHLKSVGGPVFRGTTDIPTSRIYLTSQKNALATAEVQASQRTASLDRSDVGGMVMSDSPNNIRSIEENHDCSCASCMGPPRWRFT